MSDCIPLHLPGAYKITMPAFEDHRGIFVKSFQDSLLKQSDIAFTLKESYYSLSAKDVIRGMHFQLPPHQHSKLVFCPQGAILDVIIDLRRQESTYGQYATAILSAANHHALYIPEGFAHGFHALTADAMTYYLVSSEYSNAHDTGIRFDSFGYDWGVTDPVVSERDLSFPDLAGFVSPF